MQLKAGRLTENRLGAGIVVSCSRRSQCLDQSSRLYIVRNASGAIIEVEPNGANMKQHKLPNLIDAWKSREISTDELHVQLLDSGDSDLALSTLHALYLLTDGVIDFNEFLART